MFENTILTPAYQQPDFVEDALEEDDVLREAEHELPRLARAFVASTDPNERSADARRVVRGRRYRWLDELVEDLKGAGSPLVLRPMGARPIPQQKLRDELEPFLRNLLGGAAQIRARLRPTSPWSHPFADNVEAPVTTTIVFRGVEAALRTIGATGRGYRQTAQILTGRVMELAGLTERRVQPHDGIDDARIESVRRNLRRAYDTRPPTGVSWVLM